MPGVPPELTSLLDEANKLADRYGALVNVLNFLLLGLLAAMGKIFLDRQRNRPNLHLELVDVGRAGEAENVTFGLRVTNLGEQPATRTRYTWTPWSSLIMAPVPAGFLVTKGEPRRLDFTMESDELIGHGLAGVMRSQYKMLGWLEVTYYAGWGLWRTVGTAFTVDTPEMPVQLAKIPRPPWTDYIILWKRLKEKQIRDRHIQNLDRYLQQSREHLAARGIEVELLAPRDSINRLFAELRRRRWQSSYDSVAHGFEVFAEKHYPPSSSMTIRLSANTLVDAATMVVRNAIETDDAHGS